MPILSILIALLLGVLALAFVLQPLYRHRLGKTDRSTISSLSTTSVKTVRSMGHPNTEADEDINVEANTKQLSLENEQSARSAIQEVELDFQLGNISEADYNALRERYLRRALVAMKSRYDHNDTHNHDQELDETIETRLRQMREQHDRNEA